MEDYTRTSSGANITISQPSTLNQSSNGQTDHNSCNHHLYQELNRNSNHCRELVTNRENVIGGDEYNYHCMTLIGILLILTTILLIIIILPIITRHETTPHIM